MITRKKRLFKFITEATGRELLEGTNQTHDIKGEPLQPDRKYKCTRQGKDIRIELITLK